MHHMDTPTQCPKCKRIEAQDQYDCLGLDGDDLACNNCGYIGEMKELDEVQLNMFDDDDDGDPTP